MDSAALSHQAPDSPGPRVSVVVPVFDEAANLRPLHDQIAAAMARLPGGPGWELLLVDDGSRDDSAAVAAHLAASDPRVRALRFVRNQGQSAALLAGFGAARGDLVVTLDADLQNDPADIPALIAHLEEQDVDVVSGVRVDRHDGWFRKIASRIANRVRSGLLHDGVQDVGCSLKVYRRPVLADLPSFNALHRFLPALVRLRGARIAELPVNHRPRVHGESKYTIRGRLWRGIFDLLGVWWLKRRWVDRLAVTETASEEERRPPA